MTISELRRLARPAVREAVAVLRWIKPSAIFSLLMIMVLGLAVFVYAGGNEPEQTKLSAYFPRTPTFYEDAWVRVLGINVGRVDNVEAVGDKVRVDFHVRKDVPIPKNVRARITLLNPLGDRVITLDPPFREGMERAPDGMVIPMSRTRTPAEADQTIRAITRIIRTVKPKMVGKLFNVVSETIDGTGKDFNNLLYGGAKVAGFAAENTDQLIDMAKMLNDLAGKVNAREEDLERSIDGVTETIDLLAGEREEITELMAGVADLVEQGDFLVDVFQERLPKDMAHLKVVARIAEENLKPFPELGRELINILDQAERKWWDKERGMGSVKVLAPPIVARQIQVLLQPFADAADLGQVPCFPAAPVAQCDTEKRVYDRERMEWVPESQAGKGGGK